MRFEFDLFFSLKRLNRVRYLAYVNLATLICVLGTVLAQRIFPENVVIPIGAAILSVSIAKFSAQRFRDADVSGWFGLITIIPFACFLLVPLLLAVSGNHFVNRYGSPGGKNNSLLLSLAAAAPATLLVWWHWFPDSYLFVVWRFAP